MFYLNQTSRPAIAGNPRCSVFKLGPKYNCEKRASNIALSYGIDVYKWSFVCFTSLCLYLMQNYAAFIREFRSYLEVWTFFFIWVFNFLLRKSGLIFKSPVATLLPTWQHTPAAAGLRHVQCMLCNAIIYPFKSAIMWRIQTPHLVQLMNIVSN